MAGDPFRTVRANEPMVIPAAAWNPLMDLARKHSTPDVDLKRPPQSGVVEVAIRNNSGTLLARYGVLAVDAPLITPAKNEGAFLSRVAVSGVAITAANIGAVVMAIEPIADGAIGRGIIRGVVPGKITIISSSHKYATPVAGSTVLESSAVGPVRLIWQDAGTGADKAAILDFTVSVIDRMVRITNSGPIGTTNRWDYTVEFVIFDSNGDWIVDPGSTTSPALNTIEASNAATGIQGNGVDADTIPNGFSVVPVGDGAVVRASGPHGVNETWLFEVANMVDGECAPT